jgi:ribonuclease E
MSETDVSGPEAPNPVPEEPDTRSAAPSRGAAPAASPSADDATAAPTPKAAASTGDEPSSSSGSATAGGRGSDEATSPAATGAGAKRRRRGSRGGRKRSKPKVDGDSTSTTGADADRSATRSEGVDAAPSGTGAAATDEQQGRARSTSGPRDARAAGPTEKAERRQAGGSRSGANASGRGRGRTRPAPSGGSGDSGAPGDDDRNPELPDQHREGRPASVEAAAAALVPKSPPPRPRIGDSIPPEALRSGESAKGDQPKGAEGKGAEGDGGGDGRKRRRRRGGRGRSSGGKGATTTTQQPQRQSGRRPGKGKPVEAVIAHEPTELDEETLERRRGRERKGRAVGRYSMCVHVSDKATQIAVLEGRSLIEHYVSRPSDDVSQIHGNVYLARVQNVLPGMEAAFVDIGTPKNAVLYRGDVHYDPEDVERSGKGRPRIEDVLKGGQTILCQVTKNPIGAKGARLTQEVSLPGRFVVLIPNSSTYGISKRLPDDERKRLRQILDRVKPKQHGVIVRTAAENVTTEEIEADVRRLLDQWSQIESLAKRSKAPTLLYREPDMAVRVIREEFSQDYRSVLIDDHDLYTAVRDYVGSISPELADRVEFYDPEAEALPLYERQHVHEQIHRALDRKVWLPSGGSLIIEHTEALTVIDVNTGKNVGRSSLEETVFKNNLEAAVEIARQLRLRDVGGIIVVDFIDMEKAGNRDEVVRVFRDALSRDKTRTQVFDISELGLCEMTRKRIGEGLLESFTLKCPDCEGRGMVVDHDLLPD